MIDIQKLTTLQDIIKMASLAREAGLPEQTLLAKIRRGTELNVKESQAVEAALKRFGIVLSPPEPKEFG